MVVEDGWRCHVGLSGSKSGKGLEGVMLDKAGEMLNIAVRKGRSECVRIRWGIIFVGCW